MKFQPVRNECRFSSLIFQQNFQLTWTMDETKYGIRQSSHTLGAEKKWWAWVTGNTHQPVHWLFRKFRRLSRRSAGLSPAERTWAAKCAGVRSDRCSGRRTDSKKAGWARRDSQKCETQGERHGHVFVRKCMRSNQWRSKKNALVQLYGPTRLYLAALGWF